MAVLVSAGTGFPRGFYGRFARWMAERGAVVLTYDYRGIGGSRPDDLAAMQMDYPDWGRLDMPAALKALKVAAPGLPVFHVGHSVGGHFVGFMPNQSGFEKHAFVSVGTGWWGGHHRTYNPFELFFWLGLGPSEIRKHGYVPSGKLWRGTDLPRGVFETWKRWCLKPDYFLKELADGALDPQQFDKVIAPIRSWIFSDDPIATPGTGARLLTAYPAAPVEILSRRPHDYGVKRIGHEGAFRKGMEPLWEEILQWFDEDLSAEASGA
ncbi:alpha/beta hydrolase [Brevundimonas nasdae]|uniref:Alpha/beta hydrolase n=2 Tax=Brevundimonas nasdae TaxID=172043 RepID=A0ABX8TQ35_9CAUL|nr:alpha/beta hydrolase [Brevundimonas nasdae]QYC15775.1 alpha/beta hydrolase [Brevundimonas nasdae]